MWAGCFQLVFGNIVLGIFEAWLIRRLGKSEIKSSGLMVAANFASMLVGIGLVAAAGPLQGVAARDPFRFAVPVIVGMWLIAFVMTVLVEWWFVARTAGLQMGKRSFVLSLLVQSVSYVCLIPIALYIGSMSAVMGLRGASPADVATLPGWIYYLSPDAKTVYRTRLDGSTTEVVMRSPSETISFTGRITIEPTSDNDRARLLLRDGTRHVELIKNVGEPEQCAPVEQRGQDNLAIIGNGNFGPWSTRSFDDSVMAYADYWARLGIKIDGRRYALETPFLALVWRSPVVLPDGKIVVQFGDAIVLVDPKTRRVAKIAEGLCGDVLLDHAPDITR